ncbi:XPG domain containing-domain-containing protein [Endogone sp. FLAS-F59071]|nr:XPG domain containing-domain-containing protein [Endogone sp. FLAS-F59071]|eukprot:RUS18743.1 XPG domain containing-domain-containing protein [Endogone sp. FLAS-F59071]
MGIKGLYSFVQQTPSLAHHIEWPLHPTTPLVSPQRLVIDGNAYVYFLYCGRLDWIQGGQYQDFAELLRRHISALCGAGFDLAFLFDGPLPSQKHQNRLERDTEKITKIASTLQELDRTTRTAGSTVPASSMRRLFLLPPLALDVTLQTLRTLPVTFEVCAGEADGAVAKLARQTGAYVMSRDSDYFVYNIGDAGYIPLDTLKVPLNESQGQNIVATVYHPRDIAMHLGIPPALLPLFASLAGNDYVSSHIFEAEMLAYSHDTASGGPAGQAKAPGNSAFVRIHATAMFLQQYAGTSGQFEKIMDDIVAKIHQDDDARMKLRAMLAESVRQYDPLATGEVDADALKGIPSHIVTAFREGRFSFKLMDVLTNNIFWCTPFLEDVERENAWVMSRELRRWIYAIVRAQANYNTATPTELITEYIRRGDHLSLETIPPAVLTELATILHPITFSTQLLADPTVSHRLFLHILHADSLAIRALPPHHAVLAASLRYLIHTAAHPPSAKTALSKLANHEILALVIAGLRSTSTIPADLATNPTAPPLTRRALHLSAQFQLVLVCVHLLSQVFALPDGTPLAWLYDGAVFHRAMALARGGAELDRILTGAGVAKVEFDAVMGAVEEGFGEEIEVAIGFGSESGRREKGRVAKKVSGGKSIGGRMGADAGSENRGNIFSVLALGCNFDDE